MGPGPIARWLDTFLSNRQYAELFKRYGFETLNDVCRLDSGQLINMGVSQMDSEKIMENVSVLRQTMQVSNTSYQQTNNIYHQRMDNFNPAIKPTMAVENFHTPVSTTKTKKTKASKSNSEKQKQQIPNVTVNNQMANHNHEVMMSSSGGNREAAKKIGNEIVHMAQIQSSKNYTCLPVGSNGPQLPHLNQHYNSTSYSHIPQSDNNMLMTSSGSYDQQQQQQMYVNGNNNNPTNVYNDNNGYSRMIPSGSQQQIQHQQQQQQYYNSYNRPTSYTNNYNNGIQRPDQQQQQQPVQPYWSQPPSSSSSSNGQHQNPSQLNGYYNHHHQQQPTSTQANTSTYILDPSSSSSQTYVNAPQPTTSSSSLSNQQRIIPTTNKPPPPPTTTTPTTTTTSTPLDYLERLAQLPESDKPNYDQYLDNNTTTTSSTKRNFPTDETGVGPKRQCTTESNSPIKYSKSSAYTSNSVGSCNDSPTSTCSSSSSSFSLSSSLHLQQQQQQLQIQLQQPAALSTNLIDACNFEFLDYLPELTSNTIDQTITTVINSFDPAELNINSLQSSLVNSTPNRPL